MLSKLENFQKNFNATEYTKTHEEIMRKALEFASKGLEAREVPVGCVFVKFSESLGYSVVAGSHNLTSQEENGVDHCEIVCLKKMEKMNLSAEEIKELWLYVTVEPCVMCGYALNLSGIRGAIFGCKNERFGGTGSVYSTHLMGPSPYPVLFGIREKDAVALLQKFYEMGNEKLPESERATSKRAKKSKE